MTAVAAFALVGPAARDAAAQQTPGTVILPRLDGPVELDGHPNEPAWDPIDPLPLTLYLPTYQGTPTERSEIHDADGRADRSSDRR